MTAYIGNASLRAIVITICVLLAGCATTSRQPWIDNGQRIGTIMKSKAAFGMEYRYINNAGQLLRTEKRDQRSALLPGASVTIMLYDAAGELYEERNYDAYETPVACAEGYVVKRYTCSVNDANERVVGHAFLDKNGTPVCTTNGYAFVKLVHRESAGTPREVFLTDEHNIPASGVWDGVMGVATVKYTTLDGIGDIRCGAYYNASGVVVGRKTVDGSCSYYRSHTTTTTHYR